MKIEESFAVKRNENDPRWKVYIEWLRGLENEKEDCFPWYKEDSLEYVGTSPISKMCRALKKEYFTTIYTLDEAFERFKDKGLVMPLSSQKIDHSCLIGMEMYGFKFESNDNMCFSSPMLDQEGEIGVIEYYNKQQDYVIVQFKNAISWAYPADIASHHLVNPLSKSTKANQLTREDYEKVLDEWAWHKNHTVNSTFKGFLDSIFPTPNKDRIAEINKEMERLKSELKKLEI